MNLTRRLQEALVEVARHEGRCYWWRVASMRKLAEIGFVEQYDPPEAFGKFKKEARPWRITEAGKSEAAMLS